MDGFKETIIVAIVGLIIGLPFALYCHFKAIKVTKTLDVCVLIFAVGLLLSCLFFTIIDARFFATLCLFIMAIIVPPMMYTQLNTIYDFSGPDTVIQDTEPAPLQITNGKEKSKELTIVEEMSTDQKLAKIIEHNKRK